eukprot:COSAG03_NODE_19613_length_333_cov_1.081197_2_plen_48_part_01
MRRTPFIAGPQTVLKICHDPGAFSSAVSPPSTVAEVWRSGGPKMSAVR